MIKLNLLDIVTVKHVKLLMEFNLIIEKIILNFQRNITENEKQLLINNDKDLNSEKIKPFFTISILDFRINLCLQEDFGLKLALGIEYFLIYDEEYIWKIEDDILKPLLILNSDFQYIFSSNKPLEEDIEQNIPDHKNPNKEVINTNFNKSNSNKDKSKINKVDFSKIFQNVYNKNTAFIKKLNFYIENKKLLENEQSKKNNLIYVKLILDKNNKSTTIKTYLNDLRLILNISTLARMKCYFFKILDIYSKISSKEILLKKTLDELKEEEKERLKNEEVKNNIISIQIPTERQENNSKNNQVIIVEEKNIKKRCFIKNLKDRIKYRKENNGKEIPINFSKKDQTEIAKIFDLLKTLNKEDNSKSVLLENDILKENILLQENNREFKLLFKNYFFNEEKSELNFSLHINKFDIEIPLNAESYNTEVIFINFKLNSKIHNAYEIQNIHKYKFGENEVLDFSIQDNLIKVMSEIDFKKRLILTAQNYNKSDLNVSFSINDFDMGLEKYIGGLILENDINYKLITDLRFGGYLNKFILNKKNSFVTNANIKIDPILINLGISQIKVFQSFNEQIQKVLKETDESAAKEDKEKEEREKQIELIQIEELFNKNNQQRSITSHRVFADNIITNKNQKNTNKSDRHDTIEQNSKMRNQKNERKIKDTSELNLQSNKQTGVDNKDKLSAKEEIKDIILNTTSFNQIYDFEVSLEKMKTLIYDDINKLICHLITFEVSNLKTKYIANSKPYDIENFFMFFNEIITNKQSKNFNLYNMFSYLKVKLHLDIKLFNERYNNWEPLVEPFELLCSVHQIDKASKLYFKIICDKMIDINISTNFLFTVNKILKKISKESKYRENLFHNQFIKKKRTYKSLINKISFKEMEKSIKKNKNDNNIKNNEINFKEDSVIINNPNSNANNSNTKQYLGVVDNLKNYLFTKNLGEKKSERRNIEFVNKTGIDLTCVLLDKTEQREILKVIPEYDSINFFKEDISDKYFETLNEYEKILKKNLMKIYINEKDYIIDDIDFTLNKVSIYRIDSQNWKQPSDDLFEKLNGFKRNKSNNMRFDVSKNNFYAEILVKTKLIKDRKLIILESNINFYNNTNYPIRLAFIKSGTLLSEDCISVDKNINKNTNINSQKLLHASEKILKCENKNHLKVPLKFIFNKYEVYMGVVFKRMKKLRDVKEFQFDTKDDKNININRDNYFSNNFNLEYDFQEVFKLYCSSLKFIYILGIDYLNMEIDNLEGEKRDYYLKELNDKYCSLIKFEPELLKTENPAKSKIIISSDILVLKSDDDITHAGYNIDTKDINELNEAREKSYQFIIVFNPPVVLSNKTPKEFIFDLNGDKKEILNYDDLNNFIIKPLENIKYHLFDMFENQRISKLGFKSDLNYKIVDFISNAFNFGMDDNKKLKLRLYNQENKNDFVDLIIETETYNIERIYKPNFYTQEHYFCKSRIINLYFEIIVINRIEKHILFNPISKNNLDESKQDIEKNIKNKNKDISKSLKSKIENKIINHNNLNNENEKIIKNRYDEINNQTKKYYEDLFLENPEKFYSKVELEFFKQNKSSHLIRNGEIGVFSIMDPYARGKIKIGNSEFSNDFDFYYDSLNKIVSFANSDKQFEFHCLVRSSPIFNYSKILILEPRYYVLNKTKLNLKYREVHFNEMKNNIPQINNPTNKNTILNDRLYSNNIYELNPEEEKIFLLENRDFNSEENKNLKMKNKEVTFNSKNIHELNFIEFLVDEKYDYLKKTEALDDKIDKDDDLGNVIYTKEDRNEANSEITIKKNVIGSNATNTINAIDKGDEIEKKWSSIINLDVDQDLNFKLEISKGFYTECMEKIKRYSYLLKNKNTKDINPEELKGAKQIVKLKNLFSYNNDKFYILLRMLSKKYSNGVRYLIISEPDFPDLILKNTTDYDLIMNQVGSEEKFLINKNENKIITLTDIHNLNSENIDRFELEIKEINLKSVVNLRRINDFISLDGNNNIGSQLKINPKSNREKSNTSNTSKNLFFYIKTENSNITREIKIFEKDKIYKKSDFYTSDMQINKPPSLMIDIKFKGIGISILNMNSHEYFYLSLYKIRFQSSNYKIKSLNYINNKEEINFKIFNMQVDYCKENLVKKKDEKYYENNFQTLLAPKYQYIPYNEFEIVKETFFPFINLKVIINTLENIDIKLDPSEDENVKTKKISEIILHLGEINFTLDQNMLSSIFEILIEFTDEIDFNKNSTEKELSSNVHMKEEKKDENNNIQIENTNGGRESPYKNEKDKKIKQSSRNIKIFNDSNLNSSIEIADTKLNEINNDSIIYVENLKIFPIAFNLTLKIDISSIKFESLPLFLQNLIGFTANSFTNISDLHIKFNEFHIEDIYDRLYNIIALISKNYSNQVLGFAGDIISNSKLMDNPLIEIKKFKEKMDKLYFDPDKKLKQKYGKDANRKLNTLFKISMQQGFESIDKIIRNTLNIKKYFFMNF